MDDVSPPSLTELDAKRSRLGISQKDMCFAADVAESTVSRARSEKRQPREKILRRLDRALDHIASQRGVAIVPMRKSA